MIRDFFQNWLDFIFGNGMFSMCQEILNLNPSNGDYATIWRVVTGVYDNVCVPIGMGLVLIYFMVNLIERSMQQQQIDVEQVIKLLLKLAFGLYFIENGLELMAQLYSMGISFLNSIVDANSVDGATVGDAIVHGLWTSLTGEEWEGKWNVLDVIIKGIPLLLMLIIPFIGMFIITLICIAVCYFRLIEFYIMTCAAPIAMSDFFTEGTHSNGWKFVKNYIAIALQMGIIMLALIAFNGIMAGVTPSAVSGWSIIMIVWFWIEYLALGAACCAVLLKSRSIAKEIVGVQ